MCYPLKTVLLVPMLCWYLLEGLIKATSVHNLCFRVETRKLLFNQTAILLVQRGLCVSKIHIDTFV